MTLLWVSNLLLWILVVVLALVVLALTRQVGLLHERIAPAGALSPTSGPAPGDPVDAESYADLNGQPVSVGGPAADDRATLLFFTSPTCPICRELVPVARSVAGRERLRLLFASDGGNAATHARYAADLDIARYPYLLSQALGLRFGVSRLPFAVLIGADGSLVARGLVNTREHLESLLEAMRRGVPTLQHYLAMEERS